MGLQAAFSHWIHPLDFLMSRNLIGSGAWLGQTGGRSGCRIQQSANSLLTVDVVFELINHELLITDCAFDKITN